MEVIKIWCDSKDEFRSEFKGLLFATAPLFLGSIAIALISDTASSIPKAIAIALGLADTVLTWFTVFFAVRYLLKKRNAIAADDKSAIFQYAMFAVLITIMSALCGLLFPPAAILVFYFSLLAPVFVLAEKDKAAEAFMSSAGYLFTDFSVSYKSIAALVLPFIAFFAIGFALVWPLAQAFPNSTAAEIVTLPIYFIFGLFIDTLLVNLYFAIKEHRQLKLSSEQPSNLE